MGRGPVIQRLKQNLLFPAEVFVRYICMHKTTFCMDRNHKVANVQKIPMSCRAPWCNQRRNNPRKQQGKLPITELWRLANTLTYLWRVNEMICFNWRWIAAKLYCDDFLENLSQRSCSRQMCTWEIFCCIRTRCTLYPASPDSAGHQLFRKLAPFRHPCRCHKYEMRYGEKKYHYVPVPLYMTGIRKKLKANFAIKKWVKSGGPKKSYQQSCRRLVPVVKIVLLK